MDANEGRWYRERPWELYVLLAGFGAWYGTNTGGALSVDETAYAETGWQMLNGQLYAGPAAHHIAPSAEYFLGVGQLVLGHTSIGARLPVVVAGLGVLALTYKLGERVGNRVVGIVAAALLGTNYLFARYAVRAMLDVPLTLAFLALTWSTMEWVSDGRNRDAVLVGALCALVATTKSQGFIYTLPAISAVGVTTIRNAGIRRAVSELRYPIAGGVGVLTLVYLPFVFSPHPPVGQEYGAAVTTVLGLPVVGNVAYLFGNTIAVNIGHLGEGHAVTIGSTVYQHPPVWTYLYWLYTYGAIYLVALPGTVGYAVWTWWDRGDSRALFLGWSVVVPLVVVSIITVKWPRYILPIYPLLAVGVSVAVAVAVGELGRRAGANATGIRRGLPSRSAATTATLVVVVALALAPPSGVVKSAQNPIETDSGYDEVAAFVEDYAATHDGEVVVLTYYVRPMEYYLDPATNVTLIGYTPWDAGNETKFRQLRERLETGEIDLVVTLENAPRLRSTPPHQYVRSEGRLRSTVQQTQFEDANRVLIFEMVHDSRK